MTMTIVHQVSQPFAATDIEIIKKIIYTTLYFSGFFSRYILDNEFDEKRQKCETTNKIAAVITGHFGDRIDPDRGDTYKYCLRDVQDEDLGKLMITIGQMCFGARTFRDTVSLRMQMRKYLYETDGRLALRVDQFFPLFAKPITA